MRPVQSLAAWTLASGVLILAVVLLRAVLGRRMGAGLRYALWGLVLLRLLVPVQLFTVAVPAGWTEIVGGGGDVCQWQTSIADRAEGETLDAPQTVPSDPFPGADDAGRPEAAPYSPTLSGVVSLDVPKLLGGLWLCGAAVTAAVFLASNVSFYRRLKRVRRPLERQSPGPSGHPLSKGGLTAFNRYVSIERKAPLERGWLAAGQTGDCPLYTAESLPSPCLFGVLRPAIYVTPAAAADPDVLRHVLAHEYTHFRHGDHIWNLLRGAALALHWWNPLVWLAAALSRRDCELACDEGALKRLGETERFAYGRTLLALIGARSRPADLLSCATTMTGDGRTVAQRVKRIAQAPKRWLWAAVAAVLLAGTVTVCAFGRAEEAPKLPWPEDGDSLRYVRDLGGFPDEFVIRLHRDGAFTFYEGSLSSSIGRGTWTQEGDVICLVEDYRDKHHYFTLEEDALVFRVGEPERFIYLEVAGGERFSLDTDPPERDWFDVHGDSPAPTPSAATPYDQAAEMQKALEAEQARLEEEKAQQEARRKAAEMQAGGQGQVMDSEQLDALQKALEAEEKKPFGGVVG